MFDRTVNVLGSIHVVSVCITCGVTYTFPKRVWDNHRQNGGYHTCCNGHLQGWSKSGSETDRLRLERDRLKQQIAQKDDEIQLERDRANRLKRSRAAMQGQVTRIKRRAKNGVCPCCNRSFKNLARHMKTKHPNFDPNELEARHD